MKEVLKGTFGYIDSKKKAQLIKSILLFGIVLILFVVSIVLKSYPKIYYLTVLTMLMVLPAAKMLVGYVILIPFHSVSKSKYDEVVSRVNEEATLYTDLVITSKEKIMNLDFLVITDQNVIGFIGRKKDNVTYIENYLSTNLKYRAYPHTVEILNDEQMFLEKLSICYANKGNIANLEDSYDEKELKAYLISLMV